MEVKSYKDLVMWQKAMDLVVSVYRMTASFPKEEQYGLISQMRRCAVSIPSNIAEGRGRGSRKEFLRFVYIAYASGSELETQIEIAKRLKFVDDDGVNPLLGSLTEVMKMLNSSIRSLKLVSDEF